MGAVRSDRLPYTPPAREPKEKRDRNALGARRAEIVMILVNEGTRGFVLSRVSVGEPCPHCGSEERDVVVQYQVFGFFQAFCASWGRRYVVECRRCRAELAPLAIAGFEEENGNPIPYGHRFGLAALLSLVAISVAILAIGLHNRVVTIVLLAVWAVVGVVAWRNRLRSTFLRRRLQIT